MLSKCKSISIMWFVLKRGLLVYITQVFLNHKVIQLLKVKKAVTFCKSIYLVNSIWPLASERIWKCGKHTSGANRRKCFVCLSWPSTFWFLKYNWSFWWALSWWPVQFGQFLVLLFYSRRLRAQPFVKLGARAPGALEWAQLLLTYYFSLCYVRVTGYNTVT